jgi:uncharacterized protein YndB with AHSA1/START domain
MNTKTITQSVTLPGAPAAVYSALMNEKKHTAFTGEPAKIEARIGGRFTCYGGYITGVTVDLVPKKLIVQAWRGRDWPKGYYSLVTFALSPAGGGKTKLAFTHVGVPASDYQGKIKGWRSFYWEPLKRYLAG